MRLTRVTGSPHRLDRPGQVVVQTRAGGAGEGAEAQHHALLVRLHAIEAAGEPDHDDRDAEQSQAAAAAEAPPGRPARRHGQAGRG